MSGMDDDVFVCLSQNITVGSSIELDADFDFITEKIINKENEYNGQNINSVVDFNARAEINTLLVPGPTRKLRQAPVWTEVGQSES